MQTKKKSYRFISKLGWTRFISIEILFIVLGDYRYDSCARLRLHAVAVPTAMPRTSTNFCDTCPDYRILFHETLFYSRLFPASTQWHTARNLPTPAQEFSFHACVRRSSRIKYLRGMLRFISWNNVLRISSFLFLSTFVTSHRIPITSSFVAPSEKAFFCF